MSSTTFATKSPSAADLDPLGAEIVARHPCVGLAIGVVRDGDPGRFHLHGLSDVASKRLIAEDTIFRIASITKTFTGIAVMQLRDAGLVELDAPVDRYLTSYRLEPSDPTWGFPTLRQLLTHTAGLPEVARPGGLFAPDFGESVKVGDPIPSLAEFYGGRLRTLAPPGARFVYGNHSPATLGQVVEDVSGMPLGTYFRERIFEPLGMASTSLVRTEEVVRRLATGYEIGARGVTQVVERDMVTAGAASVFSSPADMARYLAALLGGGANAHGRILETETLDEMFMPQHRPDPRLPGIGLAFFRFELAGHVAVGHQGTHPGFHSQILVAPDAGVGVMAFTNGAAQADFWLPAEVSGLLSRLLGVEPATIRHDIPHRPERWAELSGWYRLDAGLTDVRLRGMMGAGAEVFVRDGTPMLRFLSPIPTLYRGFELHPDDETDPDLFRIDIFGDGAGSMRVAFGRGADGAVTHLVFDLMPLRLQKGSDTSNPRRWALGSLAGIGLTGLVARLGRSRR